MERYSNQNIKDGYNAGIGEASSKYDNDYEFNRWFIRSRNRAEYYMTYQAIKHHLADISYQRCFELGPGPGTWTRLLYRHQPQASYQLVDISEAMQGQFMLEMRASGNVTYSVSDIMTFQADAPFDYFFSSRAVEYLEDKPAFFAKLHSLVSPGGRGAIITKNPYHGVRKSKKVAHQGQIPMAQMQTLLTEAGFSNVRCYPVVVRLPIISRLTSEVSEHLFHKWLGKELTVSKRHRFIESYLVTFTRDA